MNMSDIMCSYCKKELFLRNGDVHECEKGRLCYTCSRLLTPEEIGDTPRNIGILCDTCGEIYSSV